MRSRRTAGQRVTFRVWANRLENKIHDLQMHFDPILLLHDAQGRELAADDNHDFADPRSRIEFKEAGPLLAQIRDTTYAGNANWTYVLAGDRRARTRPRSLPMAVNPGAKAWLRAQGLSTSTRTDDRPRRRRDGRRAAPGWRRSPDSEGATLARPARRHAAAPGHRGGRRPAEAGQAQALTLPRRLSGRLAARRTTSTPIGSRRRRGRSTPSRSSPAAPARRPTRSSASSTPRGQTQAEADDTLGRRTRASNGPRPADGAFAVQVSDLHSRGGADFGYVLEAEAARPDFVLTCDPDKLNVGPGGRVPVFVQVDPPRRVRAAPSTLEWDGPPAGRLRQPADHPPAMTQGVMVVSADADAAPAAGFSDPEGKAETPDGAIVRKAEPKQEIYLPGGGRGFYAVNTLALAVTDPSDITVEAKPAEITLEPGGTATIDVTVTRRAGYEQGRQPRRRSSSTSAASTATPCPRRDRPPRREQDPPRPQGNRRQDRPRGRARRRPLRKRPDRRHGPRLDQLRRSRRPMRVHDPDLRQGQMKLCDESGMSISAIEHIQASSHKAPSPRPSPSREREENTVPSPSGRGLGWADENSPFWGPCGLTIGSDFLHCIDAAGSLPSGDGELAWSSTHKDGPRRQTIGLQNLQASSGFVSGRSRDLWKKKYAELKVKSKRLQQQVADASRSRADWRGKAEAACRETESSGTDCRTPGPTGRSFPRKRKKNDRSSRPR